MLHSGYLLKDGSPNYNLKQVTYNSHEVIVCIPDGGSCGKIMT